MTTGDKFTWSRYDTLLRIDFVGFAQRCFRELSPPTAFLMNWHIEIVAAKLVAVRAGKIRRLIINVPPRYLKSLLGSIAFPAWCLGRRPGTQIICASCAQDFADKLARLPAHSLCATGSSGPSRPAFRPNGKPWASSRRPNRAAGSPPRSAGC